MKALLYFVGGVVVGSTATFLLVRKKFEAEKEEEIASVKETYKKTHGIIFTEETKKDNEMARKNDSIKAEMITNSNIIDENRYSDKNKKTQYNLFSNPPNAKDIHNGIDEGEDLEVDPGGPKEGLAGKPYVISPEEFINEQPYYDKITLEYYQDDILSNAISDEIITDIDAAIGYESLNHFGEYEDDVVYVRNEKTSTDYEIIFQHRPFAIIPDEET